MSWQETNNSLTQTYEFADFLEAIKFVNSVAVLAEEAQHHPDIDIRYNKVHLQLTTHDQGSVVTQKDRELAEQIDTL
ncbi:MAG: 4a-hydroxytetrahydrobiopterin dehydratase [Candidatus Woesearchaeota archaeon]